MDAQTVAFDAKSDAARGGFLAAFEFFIMELKDRAANVANHVVVMVVPDHMLEAPTTIAGVEAFDKTALFQHLQRAVDGCPRDLRILLPAQLQQLLRGEVLVGAKGHRHDQCPLARPAQPGVAQVVFDDALLGSWLHNSPGYPLPLATVTWTNLSLGQTGHLGKPMSERKCMPWNSICRRAS